MAIRPLAFLAVLLATAPAWAGDIVPLPHVLATRPVALNELRPDARIGRLKPLGMIELPAVEVNGLRFSQLSGLAWDDDEGVLYALGDKGALFHLIPRFLSGKLAGASIVKAVSLVNAAGKPFRKWDRDTEGLDILSGRNGVRGDAELVISFEREPRLMRFTPNGRQVGDYAPHPALRDADAFLGNNRMLEAVCNDSDFGVITTPEAPLREEPPGQTRFFASDGRAWRYAPDAHNNISAIECLGDGKLLVLERDFGRVLGIRSALLRIATLPREPVMGEIVHTETVAALNAEKGDAVDNFEGLARHRGNRFFLVSDDNDLFIQRTLLLYFDLAD